MKMNKFFIALACLGLLITGCDKTLSSESASLEPSSEPSSSEISSSSSSSSSSLSSSSSSSSSSEAPVPEGYTVTFATTHCKVFIYEDQDYSVDPVEATSAITRDDEGNICKYVAPDENGVGEVKPQVNFKVVCDENYEVDSSCFTISGTKGQEWNDLKGQGNDIYRITKIKADISVTIVAMEKTEAPSGYQITFELTHCSVVVYAGKKGAEGTTVDEGPEFYSRNKDNPANYDKGNDAQFNFEVVPETGYEFNDGLEWTKNKDNEYEAERADVSFIRPAVENGASFNKIKKASLDDKNGPFNLTKINGAIIITLTATEEGSTPAPTPDPDPIEKCQITFTTTHCSVKVYIGEKNSEGTNIDEGPDYFARNKNNPENYDNGDNAQFNFEVVPEEGYTFVDGVIANSTGEAAAADCASFITPASEGGFANLKKLAANLYKLTKVKSDIAITLTATEAGSTPDPEPEGFEITFAPVHCSIIVYIGEKNGEGNNIDAGPVFYSRNKDTVTEYDNSGNGQINFEVVPEEGYAFADGITFDSKGEAAMAAVAATTDANIQIDGSYNKLKKINTNIYRITKIAEELTIHITCTAA